MLKDSPYYSMHSACRNIDRSVRILAVFWLPGLATIAPSSTRRAPTDHSIVPNPLLSSSLPAWLAARRNGLLIALLAALYMVLWLGPGTGFGRAFFVAHLGLFILWQPFVHAEHRLSGKALSGVACVVLVTALFLNGGLLSVWIMMLAGIIGGKVLVFGVRTSRLFFLLALGFLVMALLLMAAPLSLPTVSLPQSFDWLAYVGLPLILITMALMSHPVDDSSHEVVDFIYSLFVFLLLAVLMLGSLAAMLLFGSAYIEALLQALLLTGAVLLLLGWAWDPHARFAGLGNLFSRYMMSIGVPVEQWLQALADLALREENPERFLEEACSDMAQRLPWVTGGKWVADGREGVFGTAEGRRSEFVHAGMTLELYTQHPLSPTLAWHFNLLARLLAEFHADKKRALILKQLSYMQAIHETGARLTHDVKNLLQSLNALCSAGSEPGAASSPEYQALLRRQLPAITARLADTLGKLGAPQSISSVSLVIAEEWWMDLRQQMAAYEWINLSAGKSIGGELPAEVFSGVIENLIRNATEKRLREPCLRLEIELVAGNGGFEMTACDNGSAIAEAVASGLFVGPVSSESGYGVGLYHAARYAQGAGYRLQLTENRVGRVCFRLAPAT